MDRRERKRVLVVDDQPGIRTLVRAALEPEFAVLEAGDGREALRIFYAERPDLVLLDVAMPHMDGWETLRRIRDLSDTPIIMLTALGGESDIVRGLDGGADEYVTKPFSSLALAARVRAALRRAEAAPAARPAPLRLDDGKLIIDLSTARVWVRGAEVQLTPTEYRLLALLASRVDEVVTLRQILEQVWGPGFVSEVQYVKNYIRMLRAKIEEDPSRPRYILSRRGLGYLLSRTPPAQIGPD